MFRSATFKLTLWYLGLVMLISLGFSVVLYRMATQELASGLHHQTQRIFDEYPVFQNSQLSRPDADLRSGDSRLFWQLAGFNVVVLVGAGFASYWLARRTLRPIEEAHNQQKRFTADVSHELRTPLTAIRMESEVALMNPKARAAELQAVLGSNLEEVTKLEALINNLLRLTRLEASEVRQHFSPLSSQDVANSALAQVEKIASERSISFTNTVGDSVLLGDHDSLVQLLVVLLDNAVKYSPAQASVELSSQQQDGLFEFHIVDHGSGIAEEALQHVFDRFYRADSSRNKSTEGFGLGLSIAKMIADLHDGRITLTSKRGQGTTAAVSLPLGGPTATAGAARQPTESKKSE